MVHELDSDGAHDSQELSEVDLSDPEDVKVLTNDPDGEVLIHLGSSNFLDRYKIYVAHLREWRQQFPKLESVDLRYDRQIIVNPDLHGTPTQPPLSAKAMKAALAAGVRPAILVQHEPAKPKPTAQAVRIAKITKPPAATKAPVKTAGKHPTAKPRALVHKGAVHAAAKTAKPVASKKHLSTASSVVRSSNARQTAAVSGKPSPAIAKGQDSR